MRDMTLSEYGRWRAAQRELLPTRCEHCGAELLGTRRRRFCDAKCAAAWRYAQFGERIRGKRRERYRKQREGATDG